MGRELGHMSDEALVALVARGNDDALGALYDRFGRVAYGLAYRVIRDRTLAEDAVQDAFTSAWRGAAQFDAGRGKARTWLLTFVHRRAVDVIRREERRRTEPLEGSEHDTADAPEDDAWLSLERERVRRALAALPDQQREALELAYFEGFTQTELAARLGQPLGTIKSRMFAGLTRLRELLDTAEGDPWSTRTPAS